MRASIVICTWARPQPLERCLETLSALPDDVEILTVHAPGDDASVRVVEARFPRVAIHRAPEANLSLQRNLGARKARGEVVAYFDDDAWPRDGWLEAVLAHFADPAVVAVGGAVLDPEGRPLLGPAAVTSFGRTYPLGAGEAPHAGDVLALQGGNLAVRRAALLAAGGFDENYRYHLDETDLCMRLARAGGALRYAPEAAIFHEAAPGPLRRTAYERDWHSVAQNQVYFAFRHVRRARFLLALVPWTLQCPKLARFFGWLFTGKLSPRAFVRCLWRHVTGIFAGYRKGLTQGPRLPLEATTA